MSKQLHYHQATLRLLDSIASLDDKLGPTELIEMWFSDLYFPGQEKPQGYRSEVWERGEKEWCECFTSDELKVLAAFHEEFAREVKSLSDDWSSYRQDLGWLRVARTARIALNTLSGEAQACTAIDVRSPNR